MDDLFKELGKLLVEMAGVDQEWIADKERRIDDIVRILPSDVSTALTIISVAIDRYAAKQHLKSSELWQAMNEVATEVHKELGDYEE